MPNITSVGTWMKHLPKKDEARDPGKFTTPGKFKTLMENIHQYLSVMTSVAGVPLLCVIRVTAALPIDDPGFGLPTFDVELQDRGRHAGVYWPSSNKVVWTMVRFVCHGTEAWHHVKRFESRHNGRDAYLTLVRTYMGADIQ